MIHKINTISIKQKCVAEEAKLEGETLTIVSLCLLRELGKVDEVFTLCSETHGGSQRKKIREFKVFHSVEFGVWASRILCPLILQSTHRRANSFIKKKIKKTKTVQDLVLLIFFNLFIFVPLSLELDFFDEKKKMKKE